MLSEPSPQTRRLSRGDAVSWRRHRGDRVDSKPRAVRVTPDAIDATPRKTLTTHQNVKRSAWYASVSSGMHATNATTNDRPCVSADSISSVLKLPTDSTVTFFALEAVLIFDTPGKYNELFDTSMSLREGACRTASANAAQASSPKV